MTASESLPAPALLADVDASPPNGDLPLRLVTERILLSALRAHDAEAAAEVARERAEFLAAAGVRFGATLDEELTYAAIASLSLPGLRGWCVVDVVEASGGLRRLAVLHPDEEKRAALHALADHWKPTAGDAMGVPAVIRARQPTVVSEDVDSLVAATTDDPETQRILKSMSAGSFFVVPVVAHDVLLGAITFVSGTGAPVYTADDIALAEALATRCAQAIEAARLYAAAKAAWADAETARAEAEHARQLADTASAAKSLFLRTMSHELRTPLNAISGYAQIIEMGLHGPVTPEQRIDLASIQRSQLHLLGMIDAVLQYARIETGHLAYEVLTVEVADVLAWANTMVAPQAHKRQLVVAIDTCGANCVVRADPQRVRQIVVNLLSNAVKFSNLHGRIDLSCGARDGMVAITVSDNGIGIPPDYLEAIFAPFVQVQADLTRSHEGTGLGLAISREMARDMNGDLTVESAVGEGSTFTLTLPSA